MAHCSDRANGDYQPPDPTRSWMKAGGNVSVNPRCAQFHSGAGRLIQHPGRHHNNHSRGNLDVSDLVDGAMFGVMATNLAAEQRMPTVLDLNFLPDMGRMFE